MFEIDSATQKVCVTSTSFGIYKYKRLPMGITNSPDFFQSVMHHLFADLLDVALSMALGYSSLVPFQIISLKSTKCSLGWRGMGLLSIS